MATYLTHLGLGSALELDKPLGIELRQSNLSLAKCRLETTSRRRSIVSHDGIAQTWSCYSSSERSCREK